MGEERTRTALSDLLELMSRLRGPGGCPWDRQQTDATITMYLLEEAYEVLDAVDRGSPEDVCEELGDLLFQIIFLAKLAEERGEFDITGVMEKITGKMKNRHPHVFGRTKVAGPEDVALNWEKIKQMEKDRKGSLSSPLEGIPPDLPALMRANRLTDRASKRIFTRQKPEESWAKIEETFGKLRDAALGSEKERIGESAGDLLFNLVNFTRQWGLNAERLLRNANRSFLECLQRAEEELKVLGIDPESATPDDMIRAWDRALLKTE
jgi:MazG family protein